MEITAKEASLIETLRKQAVPYGEVLIRFFYQDGVIVRIVVEDKKESFKL